MMTKEAVAYKVQMGVVELYDKIQDIYLNRNKIIMMQILF